MKTADGASRVKRAKAILEQMREAEAALAAEFEQGPSGTGEAAGPRGANLQAAVSYVCEPLSRELRAIALTPAEALSLLEEAQRT